MDNLTIVSGYWTVKNKHSHDKYTDWFKNSLKINQRYIFFCDKKDNEYILNFRNNYETVFVDYPIHNFYSNSFYNNKTLHPIHVPSHELAKIWHEKIHLLKLAKDMDQNPTDFYIWADAGVCTYRDIEPPQIRLNLADINSLPQDRICFSKVWEEYHNYAATVHIMHKNIIDKIHGLYYDYLKNMCEIYKNDWICGSDQFIFTKILDDHPELFHQLTEDYGMNLAYLYLLT